MLYLENLQSYVCVCVCVCVCVRERERARAEKKNCRKAALLDFLGTRAH